MGAGSGRTALGRGAVRQAQLDHRRRRGLLKARHGIALALLALLLPASSALAADAATDAARLKGRLAPAIEASVLTILDGARGQGVPRVPLVARELEGWCQPRWGED